MTTIPSSGFYSDVMNGFFGNLTTAGKNQVWSSFLSANNLATNPPETAVNEQKFIAFIQGNYQDINVTQLSPEEIANRQLTNAVIQAIITLLNTLHDAVATGVGLQKFYAEYQAQYTNMMAGIPWAIANASQNPNVPTGPLTPGDLKNFTTSYNGISIQDIIDYTISPPIPPTPKGQPPAPKPPPTPFTLTAGGYNVTFIPPGAAGNSTPTDITNLINSGVLPAGTTFPAYIVQFTGAKNPGLPFDVAVPLAQTNGSDSLAGAQAFIDLYQNPVVQVALSSTPINFLTGLTYDYSQMISTGISGGLGNPPPPALTPNNLTDFEISGTNIGQTINSSTVTSVPLTATYGPLTFSFIKPGLTGNSQSDLNTLIGQGLLPASTTEPVYLVTLKDSNGTTLLASAFAVGQPETSTTLEVAGDQAFFQLYTKPVFSSLIGENVTSILPPPGGTNVNIPWPNDTGSTTDISTQTAENQKLTQFVSVDKGYQQAIKDSASSAQTVLDASNTAVSNQDSVIEKSIQMLKSMLNSIYSKNS